MTESASMRGASWSPTQLPERRLTRKSTCSTRYLGAAIPAGGRPARAAANIIQIMIAEKKMSRSRIVVYHIKKVDSAVSRESLPKQVCASTYPSRAQQLKNQYNLPNNHFGNLRSCSRLRDVIHKVSSFCKSPRGVNHRGISVRICYGALARGYIIEVYTQSDCCRARRKENRKERYTIYNKCNLHQRSARRYRGSRNKYDRRPARTPMSSQIIDYFARATISRLQLPRATAKNNE
ncbi:unnamed protein product [Trichogramma brassicae]|uniref:Uncharacterized protein n=1 Tax=Trichogramma brassicae TaxID=86971 RepID=A0A6H5J190_9HYME|nr:unnamed protein product [Trichogramma brassicae]